MESVENRFYVYVYLDPRKPGNYTYGDYHFDYEPFYVGKGSGNRFENHLNGNDVNEHFDRTIKKIQRVCGCNPIIVKYQDILLEQDSFDLEIKMIATIGRHDLKRGPLCNHTNGGDGLPFLSSDCIKKRALASAKTTVERGSLRGSNHPLYGKTHTDEVKQMLSINHVDVNGENNPRAKRWEIVSPLNMKYSICGNLKHFCKENKLSYRNFVTVRGIKNNNKLSKNFGWTIYEI